ncbi:transcriptional regulator NrdR [Patescibacteria group bacterium]|nr:transcriptional regulator NrdR [Patescibacteria group bacterium]MBU1673363.1 transcriptional regulator NrdR [Patescibacteria group bacterium]MBU1963417.1 transcriptional regulator NrdR [Patescibacteria group bacterium]
MKCPSCHNLDTKVVDSRVLDDNIAIRRRRECEKCGFRFSTMEEVEILNLTVMKREGQEMPYDKERLVISLQKALQKRPMTPERLKRIIQAIEQDIQNKSKNDRITSEEIGEIVMKHLKKADKVAYIRFASVYRDFEDIEAFSEEVNKLINKKRNKK